MSKTNNVSKKRLSTGVVGLDEVLDGGLLAGGAYLVRGCPGSGKTTLGMHFLGAGSSQGEKTLFITIAESEAQLRRNATNKGFDLTNVAFLDLSPTSDFFTEVQSYDIFSPAEVEREPITQRIVQQVQAQQPKRIFVDSVTQFRYLAVDEFQFHKQILSFLRFLQERDTTVLLTSEAGPEAPDEGLQFLVDGIINLEIAQTERTLSIYKFRNSRYDQGNHSMILTDLGMKVFPRVIPDRFSREFEREVLPSAIPGLDKMLHGGIERGTVTMLSGPGGAGKTSMGIKFLTEAAMRGERSVVCCFDETPSTLVERSRKLNMPIDEAMEAGNLVVSTFEPLDKTPDEFAHLLREEVEQRNTKLVMLDSISGYHLCFPQEYTVEHMHRLCRYLKNMGVAVIVINEVQAISGKFQITDMKISYLADNVLFLRYLEVKGELRKAVGVLKKRLSDFEKTLRPMNLTSDGIKVGEPMLNLRGILKGHPEFQD
ncbi:MAG: ATPase domain-containing protein [Cyanobacteriota bacterium]|nr:ATPase domain-containing protein [Cyanobacteriota bacterium]